jgi:hypothetical protein
MDLAGELAAIRPVSRPSPVPGFEHVRGYGVFALPFDSGHVLALRVFPQNDFAPYRTIWHRTPEGAWSIYVDGPRLDIACPRYFSSAAERNALAHITVTPVGRNALSITMDLPRLEWHVAVASPVLVTVMNALSRRVPESVWRQPAMLRAFERLGGLLFDLGDITLSGAAPNGHASILVPRQMFPIVAATARLDGQDLGKPVRARENPRIGALRLPARAIFAMGAGYFELRDPVEYQRTVAECRSASGGQP